MRIKDKNLHVECFKCSTCGSNLKNQGYYNLNNKLYCDIHARLAALSSPPPNSNGMVPVTVPPYVLKFLIYDHTFIILQLVSLSNVEKLFIISLIFPKKIKIHYSWHLLTFNVKWYNFRKAPSSTISSALSAHANAFNGSHVAAPVPTTAHVSHHIFLLSLCF